MENASSSTQSGDPPRSADATRQPNQARSGTPPSLAADSYEINQQSSSTNVEPCDHSSARAAQPDTPQSTPSQPAPATTLWENFMTTFRTVIQGNDAEPNRASHHARPENTSESASTLDTHARPSDLSQQASAPSASASSPSPAAAEASASGSQTTGTRSNPSPSALPRPPVFFRLPFAGADGNPAILAFYPQPLPPRGGGPASPSQPATTDQNGPQNSASPSSPQRSDANGNSAAESHSHAHPDGHVPISPLFVPFGASPMPFSFIYDAHTQTAWPIAQVTPGSPPGGPAPDAPDSQQSRLVAGPPFRIILDIRFTAEPEPERPDPQRAADYVKQLERADAELRARMARLSMGSIGGFGAGDEDQDALLGCGVCLDNYDSEDRPEWIDGPKSQDQAVVAVPCPGHHTLHAGCLRDWLEKLPPSQWTCPFCRANLNSDSTSTSSKSISSSSAKPVLTTLREEVRARERQRGWRCDAPACLPRYPTTSQTDTEAGHHELPEASDDMTTDLVKISPCHHEVHLDCLCTSMRVENNLAGTKDLDELEAQLGEADAEDDRATVGKWVTCPSCRKECWAELPLRRRPYRAATEVPTTPTQESSGEIQKGMKPTDELQHIDSTTPTVPDADEEASVAAMLVFN